MGSGQPPRVCYEDDSLLVVDKPAGLHTAPLRRGERETLLAWVIERWPEVAELPGVKDVEPGLVHRLDRETSGCVVVARTAEAFLRLRDDFAAGRAEKEYVAVCACPPQAAAGETLRIESRFAPFGERQRKVRVVMAQERGRSVLRRAAADAYTTEATIIARVEERALLRARITRGFRHQIRAHLAYLGYPILGDPLYGAPAPERQAQRMYLHACRISMTHPTTGAALVVASHPPEDFSALFPGAAP